MNAARMPAASTGWEARLALRVERRGAKSVLAHAVHRGPLVVQKPLYPEGPAVCQLIVVHPPGGIVVVSAFREANAVVLQVKDTGEGIAAEELARIWERFYRTENARKQPGSGTGLGLAITRKLVELHVGTIWLESQKGQGSRFSFTLPLAAA